MKKKFGLWLNIVTICLCVCAIAIGVYAATSATLTVSGQIGFEAHGVDVSVAGTLSGYVTGENESTVQNDTDLGTVTLANKDSKAMSLGENPVYFTDLAGETIPSITLKLDITNNSKFKVRANVSFPTTITNNVSISADKETLVLNANGGVGEVTYTFAISNAETSITDTLNLATITDLKVDFVKFTGYEQGEFYVEDGKLYVEYGYNPTLSEEEDNVGFNAETWGSCIYPTIGDKAGKPMRWYAFAELEQDASTNEWSVTKTISGNVATTQYDDTMMNFTVSTTPASGGVLSFDSSTNYVGKTYYFISEYVLPDFGMFPDSVPEGKVKADYDISKLRQFLINTEADGFSAKYSLTNTPFTITPRDVPAEETLLGGYGSETLYTTMSEVAYDDFWLISYAELHYFAVSGTWGVDSEATYPCGEYITGYWLRTAYNDVAYCNSVGGTIAGNMEDYASYYALRPAFQVTIS